MFDFHAILFNKINQTFSKKIYWANFNKIYYDYFFSLKLNDFHVILRKINFWNTLLYDYRCPLEKVNIVLKKDSVVIFMFH